VDLDEAELSAAMRRTRTWLIGTLVGIGVFAVGILILGWLKSLSHHDDLWFELAKTGLTLTAVTVIGTVVNLLTKSADARRASLLSAAEERRALQRRRDDVRVQVLRDIISCYNEVKSVRRNLRALGLCEPKGPLTEDQVIGMRLQMARLNEAQLMFEALKRGTKGTQPFDAIEDIHSALEQVEKYLNNGLGDWDPGVHPEQGGILEEWQVRSGRLVANTPANELNDLVSLQVFVGPQEGGFEEYLSTPLDKIIDTARKELLGAPR
jgi:hypothetical protein